MSQHSHESVPSQISLADWIEQLDKAGLLRRYTQEKRVDELPQIMEDNPNQAVLVEHVKDSAFPFFANGYASRAMHALALGCDPKQTASEVAHRTQQHFPAHLVETAPCKEVVLKGDQVDLTIFPLFHHHTYDGQAYVSDGRIITKDPTTGRQNDGIQRLMFRSKNALSIDDRALTHKGSINTRANHADNVDTSFAVCIGGPTLDQISSMMRLPDLNIDAWDKLGGFLGTSAQIVKCETVDLTVPANAEIVLEGRILTSEGWIHDEGPYGEYPGTYEAELAKNWNAVIDCITYRKGAVYQGATIAGLHPGRTDMFVWGLAIEGELFDTLRRSGLDVQAVRVPEGSVTNMLYASIKPVSGGDAKQALAVMLSGSRQQMPKIAYVFDQDIDIFDDEQVQWAKTWRYNPGSGTLIVPDQNMNPLDPSLSMDAPPFRISKIGFDCTAPLSQDRIARVAEPIPQPQRVESLTEEELVKQMTSLIQQAPRSWREILAHFAGQPYPLVYRAFGQLRPRLGRMADQGPEYPYTFADTDFVYSKPQG